MKKTIHVIDVLTVLITAIATILISAACCFGFLALTAYVYNTADPIPFAATASAFAVVGTATAVIGWQLGLIIE